MNRHSRVLWLVASAALLILVGYLWASVTAAKSAGEAEQAQDDQASAETQQAQAEADRWATLSAISQECRNGNLPKGLRYLCVQVRQLRDQADPDDPEVQDAEIQEPEVDDPDPDDPERQDPDRDDPEAQQDEVQDGEVDDPDPDDPETQDPEIQDPEQQDPEVDDPEPNDPQDPPATATYTFPFGTYICTRDEGSDPRNPTYTCEPA